MVRFVLVLLVVVFFSQSDQLTTACFANGAQCKPCFRSGSEPGKEIINKAPDVTDVALEKSELHLKKREDPDKPPAYDDSLSVEVNVTAEDPEDDVLTYNYTISGGRLVGTGKKVFWNLNGVQAGTYTVTAGVDDGCGICGETMTKSITVVQD